ncbi:MAG TPA: PLDc_N domain-containing protein [Candidatus Desulfofervidus auxilii]|uniref:PLDc_N domain-containing protein n=1 Tax=Desulfofervidus auxilii TaxID=1621989 RepID=A0A7C0U2V0_DESA2|nr:PLD nuclease N-terminal domain-containing protein [Candidatus Desulfofervidus auxilii]HDD43985.1 PLDc_N domain-containing protein [Candidatus Desulfofervidus auxilii]
MANLTLKQWILLIIIFLLPMVPNFWAIIELFLKRTSRLYLKTFWLGVVIFIPCLGGLSYLFFGRRMFKEKKDE